MSDGTIDRYLSRRRDRLPASSVHEAVLAEVADHLRSCAADVGDEERAIERFGPVESLTRRLDLATAMVRRVSLTHAVALLVLLVASLGTWNGPWLTGYAGGPAPTLATFMLVQVAWAVGALTLARAWFSRHLARPSLALRVTSSYVDAFFTAGRPLPAYPEVRTETL